MRTGDAARRRLQQAALELFQERGYDATTAAQIAARAGVTERTFFRHFPDKREVLFDGEAQFRAALAESVATAPGQLEPLGVLRSAFRTVTPMLEAEGPYPEPKHAVIARTPALQERQLAKSAGLVGALADGLRARGVESEQATLAAQVGMAAFGHAMRSWAAAPASALQPHLDQAFQVLSRLV